MKKLLLLAAALLVALPACRWPWKRCGSCEQPREVKSCGMKKGGACIDKYKEKMPKAQKHHNHKKMDKGY